MACAGNPSHCKRLQVLRRFSVFRTCVGTPNTMFQSIIFVDFAMVTRDYRECSHYSRISVGTPELQLSNTFINVLGLIMMHVERLPSEFRECAEDSL